MIKKERGNPAFIHMAAFLIPVLALAATWAAVGIKPFGEMSVLAIDMRNQYVSFFAYLRDELLLGGQSWFYSFSKLMGGDMAGFSAYYLLSPFNLLLVLFPTHTLPYGIALVTLMKIGCSALAMSFLLNRRSMSASTLLFSIPYALMDYNNAYQQNIMWLDGVILLPIIIIGIERILEGKSPLIYIISLGTAIITCYYVGYMMCLFSLLYFAISFFVVKGTFDGVKRPVGLLAHGVARRYVLASVLGVGLSSIVLLPAVLSLAGGKAGFSLEVLKDPSFATLPDVVSRYLPGTLNMGMLFFGYPQIYCGMLALVCTILYFLSQRVTRAQKIGAGLVLAALMASFCIGPLDRVWHGFNKPVGFLFRYSFMLSFMLLYLGWQGFRRLQKDTTIRYLPHIAVSVILLILLVKRKEYTYITTGKILLGVAVMLLIMGALLAYKKKNNQWIVLILLFVVLADVGANLYLGLRRVEYFPYDYYASFVKRNKPVVEGIKQGDKAFYRLEITDTFSDNDPLLLGYHGLSHFSSSDKMFVRSFMRQMGFTERDVSAKYSGGSTVAADDFFGIKYLLTREPPEKPYTLLGEESGIQTWRNDNAFPLGFVVDGDVSAPLPEDENFFVMQNALWRAVAKSAQKELYRIAENTPQVLTENVGERDFYGEALYEKQNPDAEAFVQYTLKAESTDEMYMLVATNNMRGCDVYVGGKKIADSYLTPNKHGILALGSHKQGTSITVRLVPKGNELFIKNAWFAYENHALLDEIAKEKIAGGFSPGRFSQSKLEGTVNNASNAAEAMLFTIPYDGGWQVLVDGEAVNTRRAFDTFILADIPPGEHNVTLKYIPRGFVLGASITAFSLALLFGWVWHQKRRNTFHKPNGVDQKDKHEVLESVLDI